ncbi:RusA family crossover junction endodeoxyribonuclease [Azospirillum canadense]|uniref:RusA family crossover junction endodeoxyribonuclease n=1 Tax=Azospirillum canadense TaxID=403962 RepID=UPI0022262737|nr:RusA family crossover junction endodeoxyribonuclease [Azospirillum canadense]MCW2242784.1 Holliday junction resolvase RusA-like endonuclease [Azospirillum canadense]
MTAPLPTWVRGDVLARFTIPGEPAAKGNSRKLVTIKGRPALIKSEKGLAFEAVARLHVPELAEPYDGDVSIEAAAFYKTRQPDLDTSLVRDAIQGRIIVNDRQVRHVAESGFIDKNRPRVEVIVYKATLKLMGAA